MPKNKKRFIDKNKAVTFQLVHRSQHDPLITDETAPQHVLLESGTTQPQNKGLEVDNRRKELQKFGVFFDDDYDYLQHLRESDKDVVAWEKVEPTQHRKRDTVKEEDAENEKTPALQLPSSVFASKYEEKEGLLRKAAPRFGPRPDWDPDVVAALDEDFDFDNPDNELEDNFMEMAMVKGEEENQDGDDEDEDCDSNDLDYSDDEEGDELGPLNYKNFNDEETKSRFTEYSMSSSVVRRNEQLTLLDDRFEKFFDQYDDNEIGALDCEDIDGHIDLQDELLLKYAIEFKRDQTFDTYDKNWDTDRILKCQEHSSTEDLVEIEVKDDTGKKWDCESILSTYSNLYNHPKLIQDPIKINPKTGIPLNVLDGDNGKLTAKTLAQLNGNTTNNNTGPKSLCAQSVLSTLSVLSIRPKDETLEEKRERKKLLKEYRFERRAERKANSVAFTQEKKRQEKMTANNRINIQGKKIV